MSAAHWWPPCYLKSSLTAVHIPKGYVWGRHCKGACQILVPSLVSGLAANTLESSISSFI